MISSKDYLHIIWKCAQISIFTFCIYKYMYFQKKEIIVIFDFREQKIHQITNDCYRNLLVIIDDVWYVEDAEPL